MKVSIKSHPFYIRMKAVPLDQAAAFVSDVSVQEADKETRKRIFREFSRLVMGKHKERKQYGFNSDPGGEIMRGLEKAYQAGVKAANAENTSMKGSDK